MSEYMGHTVSSAYTVNRHYVESQPNDSPIVGPWNKSYTAGGFKPTMSGYSDDVTNTGLVGSRPASGLYPGLHPAPYGTTTVCTTPARWLAASHAERTAADTVRSQSELVRADAKTLCQDACTRTRKAQMESTKRLGDRADEIKFWRDQLKKEADLVAQQTKALAEATKCLEKALAETQKPLDIALQCLQYRQQRIGVDLIDDCVHEELLKEVDEIRRVQNEMRRMLEGAKAQIASCQSLSEQMEAAIGRKNVALTIDTTAKQLSNTSRGLQTFEGVENIENTTSTPDSWMEHADDLIKRAMKERSAAKDFKSNICQLLIDCANSLFKQWNNVNAAFTDRIRDYMDAKHTLEVHLARVQQEMSELEKAMEMLRHCIKEKEAPMKVVQTRMATRLDRPDVEACRDMAKLRLTEEVIEIKDAVEELRAKLADTERAMCNLAEVRASLERDLHVKNNSLQVDRELCMGLRKSHDMTPRICSDCCSR